MARDFKPTDPNQLELILSRIERLLDKKLANDERLLDKKLASDEESQEQTNKSNFRSQIGGYLAVAITLAVGGGGIIANAYLENRDRDDQTMREANERKTQIIGGISWEESISDYCKKDAPSEDEWISKQRTIEDQMILSPVTIFANSKSN